jgi:hypothetical protein
MIKKAGYSNMNWLDALAARAKPKDPQSDLGQQNEQEIIENALESTANVAFDMPIRAESKNEALRRASKEISDKQAVEDENAPANAVRAKMAAANIDPVAIGIVVMTPEGQRPIRKDEWERSTDARWLNQVATVAAIEHEKRLDRAWEQNAIKPQQHLDSTFSKESRAGMVMSAKSASEDIGAGPTRMPQNASSIFDPSRLDSFASGENAHDASVAKSRQAAKEREQEKKDQYKPNPDESGPEPMKSGRVMASGSQEREVFVHRSPSNQLSMADNLGDKLSPEELKQRLSDMFASRIPDNKASIVEANEKRREEIQGKKKEVDRSWEKPQKTISTADIQKRLTELWLPPAPDGQ